MKSREIQERLDEGYLQIHVLLEIIGNPKEHIEKAIRLVGERIEDEDGIHIIEEDYGDAEETEEGLYGVFAELELLVDGLEKVAYIANNFSPASIELITPDVIEVGTRDFDVLFGDILSKVHMNNTQIVEAKSRIKQLTKSLNALVRNAILLALKTGDKTAEELSKQTGVGKEDTKAMLQAMVKENRLQRDEDTYSIKS